MGTELVEEPDAAVLGPERDVVLTEEADRDRPGVVGEVRREREREPVVLAHEAAHRRVAVDAGQPVVLLSGHHGQSLLLPSFWLSHCGAFRGVGEVLGSEA